MSLFEFDFGDQGAYSDWGEGQQYFNPAFPVGTQAAVLVTASLPSTTGEYVLVAKDEVGTVTRQGASRMLVRLDRRRNPVSVYFPSTLIEAIETPKAEAGPEEDECRTLVVDGLPVRVLGGEEMSAEATAAFGEVVRAARRRLADEKEPAEKVHWVGDHPTSLHGMGAGGFHHTTRNVDDVTCRLCRVLLARGEDES